MTITTARIIAVLIVLALAGISIGCDREVGGGEVYMGEPGGDDQDNLGVGTAAEVSAGHDEATQEARLGQSQDFNERRLEQVQVEVAEQLGVPSDVVVVDSEVRQKFDQATTDTELRAWATISTVEDYLTRLNVDALDQVRREAALELQQQIVEVERELMQRNRMQSEDQEQPQARRTETNIDDQLSAIGGNWEELSDEWEPADQPIGGGPVDKSPEPDESSP
jgi:hypothetical protein